jgi:hypothetical protein
VHFDGYNVLLQTVGSYFSLMNGAAECFRGWINDVDAVRGRSLVGGVWTNVGAVDGPIPRGALVRIDAHIKLSTPRAFELYLNGLLITEGSGFSSDFSSANALRLFSVVGATRYSQVIVATEDTRDCRLIARQPLAAGHWNDGTGSVSDVNSLVPNDATAINLPAVGDRRTFTKSTINLPAGTIPIDVSVSGRMRANGGVVGDGAALLRISATDYETAPGGVPQTYQPLSLPSWTVNPMTGVPFTAAELNALEFGLRAKA